MRTHLIKYDEWAAEIDRAIKWAALMLNPIDPPPAFEENDVKPLCEVEEFQDLLVNIPAASEIYKTVEENENIPLSVKFSNVVSRVAPYLSLKQVYFILSARKEEDWQPRDLRRLKYISSVKKKVMEISESYGGLSFLPQSFLVSIFVGEATRTSLRAGGGGAEGGGFFSVPSPAGRIASFTDLSRWGGGASSADGREEGGNGGYELGDSLLGPADVAILLQAGLTSPLKASTVVQLNQRMLIDLVASQPTSFATAVLAEIGTPGGHGSPRVLAGALMALLEMNQESFTQEHKLDMVKLLESWLGLTVPRREDFMAGGRWARQSYYEAIFRVACNILEDAESYQSLKGHLQRRREHKQADPIRLSSLLTEVDIDEDVVEGRDGDAVLALALKAKSLIEKADKMGSTWLASNPGAGGLKTQTAQDATMAYQEAFAACSKLLEVDKLAFQVDWFKDFWRRNYDALMVLSVFENCRDNVDQVRPWLDAMLDGARTEEGVRREARAASVVYDEVAPARVSSATSAAGEYFQALAWADEGKINVAEVVSNVLDCLFYDEAELESLKKDPLVFLLIPNEEGLYEFSIISAMGVITEGAKGTEMEDAYQRLKAKRGVQTIRADTATVRSFEYNASKIEEAIEKAVELDMPYGYVGYSQGCANCLTAESLMLSGTPKQKKMLEGLVGRQLLFSAANGSLHGSCSDKKAQTLIIQGEQAFKQHQGYFSKAFISAVLGSLNDGMDSAACQKFLGGAQSMLPAGCRAFWREAQHKDDVPTCVIRGVLEDHTTPEALDMLSNALTKQSGSGLHDSQVHVYDAVGHPVYTKNRNGRVMRLNDMGGGVQRTHHWSPLNKEVEKVTTSRDERRKSFECAKDRHIVPFCDVNARFGVISYQK